MMTLAPFLTNSAAVAFPMPLAPPVITATFPANLRTYQVVNLTNEGAASPMCIMQQVKLQIKEGTRRDGEK
jgi:hypothetical protein